MYTDAGMFPSSFIIFCKQRTPNIEGTNLKEEETFFLLSLLEPCIGGIIHILLTCILEYQIGARRKLLNKLKSNLNFHTTILIHSYVNLALLSF